FPVIARWLARQNPQANLIQQDEETDIRAMEIMEYVVGTVHPEGVRRLFRTERFAPSAADHEAVRKQGREARDKGFVVLDKALAGRSYISGNHMSYADAALFYVEHWGAKRLGMTLPKNLAAHFERMMARPAVQRALRQEGVD